MKPANRKQEKPFAIKPQDLVVCARLAIDQDKSWSYGRLAEELGMSSQTVHSAIKRLARARLFNAIRRRVAKSEFLEFVEHGVRYAFPAQPHADRVPGVPTGVSAPPLADKILAGDEASIVWPAEGGSAIGRGLVPLHPSAPRASKKNARLYEVLALIDAVRVGGARERGLAAEELRKRVS